MYKPRASKLDVKITNVSQYRAECCRCWGRWLISRWVRHPRCRSWQGRSSPYSPSCFVPVMKLDRKREEEQRVVTTEQVRIEIVRGEAIVDTRAGSPSGDVGNSGKTILMLGEAAIDACGAEEYVDVVRCNTAVRSCAPIEFEGFTFLEPVSHAFAGDWDRVVDNCGLPLCTCSFYFIFSLPDHFTYWALCNSF